MFSFLRNASAFILISGLLIFSNIVQAVDSDANNDGKTDFVLRHEGFPGTWFIAYMNGPGSSTVTELPGLPPGDGYYLESVADLDGDGYMDFIIRDGLQNFYVYLVANGAVKKSALLSDLPNFPYWKIVLRRDMDGDNKTDLIIYNQAEGLMKLCFMNGTTLKSPCKDISGMPPYISGNYWGTEIKTAGNYSSSNFGSPSFIADRWNLSTFNIERWIYTLNFFSLKVTGSRFTQLENVADVSWVPVGSFDYDSDGRAEIVMKNNLTTEWMAVKVDGTTVLKTTKLFTAYAWELAGGVGSLKANLRGDGKRQIVMRHPSLNTYKYYEFNGSSIVKTGSVNLPALPYARVTVGTLTD